LEELLHAPTITVTVLEKEVPKDGLKRSGGDGRHAGPARIGAHAVTAGDGGVDKRANALLAFMQFCANGDLIPCVARCFGTAKHVFIVKNAASGVTGGLRPLAIGTVLRRLSSIPVFHNAIPFAADYLL
jgi:hypothetical protein